MRNKVLIVTVVASILVVGLFGTPQVEAQSELDRHLVLFNGSAIPRGFTSDVEALGGSVVFSHKVGIAIVDGLTDDAAAQIGASNKVSAIQRNETFYLDPIMGGAVEAAGDAVPLSPGDPTTAARYARQWNMRAIEADAAWAADRLASGSSTRSIE